MIDVTYVYCKIWHCYCSFKNINNLYKNNLEDYGMISVRVLDDHINTRINHIQYYITEGLIIFWNWFLELKMYKRHLYYPFFYFFNLFTITLTGFFILHRCVILPGRFLNRPFGVFLIISLKLQVSLKFWSMIRKPDKIPLPVIGETCM